MQSVNDDMDELYRKAAENYPLKTDGANWEKLLQQMQQEPPVSHKEPNKSRFLWLLLLLPMFFICNRYVSDGTKPGQETARFTPNTKNERTDGGDPIIINNPVSSIGDKLKTTSQENRTTTHKTIESDKLQATKDGAGEREFKLLTEQALTIHQNISNTKWNKRKATSIVKRTEQPVAADVANSAGERPMQVTTPATNNETSQTSIASSITDPHTEKADSSSQTKDATSKATDSLQKSAPVLTDKNKNKARHSKLYYGLIAGSDFSTVKMQKLQGVGYNFGVIAGYKLTKKINVETGILWNNKKYYSKGEYFDPKNMGWPAHTELIYVSGSCDMFELPFNIRYDWMERSNQVFFATTGLSSYIMNKESYDYRVKRYNNTYNGSRDYHHSTQDLFSVINLTVGYQRKLGVIGDLRVEPYFKLPINGLGIGSMSIASTGVNVGFTRSVK